MRTSQQSRKIAPRDSSTSSASDTGRTSRLPTELLSEQAQRLVVFSTVALVLWSFALLLDSFLMPWFAAGWVRNWRAIILQLFGAGGSAVMCWYLRRASTSFEEKSNAGIAMMLMQGAGIAGFNAWAVPPAGTDIMRISWICLLILIFAMIAPSTPRRMFIASLVVASFDPIAYWLAWLFGGKALAPAYVFVISWPTYACAFVAVVPARVLQRLGRRLREAQDLGSYQLVERLGAGGMGEVWRAEHRLLARDAAIKLMRPEVLGARNESEARLMLKRFEREAQATAALSSPHTIQVFDFGVTQEGTFYYVMELLNGATSNRWCASSVHCHPTGCCTCCVRSAIRSPTPTHAGSCIATSSRPTSTPAVWVSNTTSPRCSTSAWSRFRPDRVRRAILRHSRPWSTPYRERRPTWRPKSSSATPRSIGVRTSTHWAAWRISC
jgi:hypothetical protein